jgi:hypothetical protein
MNKNISYTNLVNLLKSYNNENKNKIIKKSCDIVNNNFNFIDYIKNSKYCGNLLCNTKIETVNDFRDKIVEKISDDFLTYIQNKGYVIKDDKEKTDIKFTVVGLIGELFNIFYLENLSVLKDKNTGIVKRFKCVLPFNVVTNQNVWGADLICLNQNDELCAVQVKFYSSWSIAQGHKIELKKHCFGLLMEIMRVFEVDFKYCTPDHAFVTILGKKTDDVSISLQNSPYKNCFEFIDKFDYFNATAGNSTVFTEFYDFLININ